jgi:hypothetical protein
MVLGGPLADFVFTPAMQPGGVLAPLLGNIFGTGPGAGMAVMIALFGLLGTMIGVSGYLFPAIRNVEDLLPDYVATPAAEPSEPLAAVA